MVLTPQNVDKIFFDCTFETEAEARAEHAKGNFITAKGLKGNLALNAAKVAEHKKAIKELIDQLPYQINEGMSFLDMCFDQYGHMWTVLHKDVDKLIMLGLAADLLAYCVEDTDYWHLLPSGLPYVIRKENLDRMEKIQDIISKDMLQAILEEQAKIKMN